MSGIEDGMSRVDGRAGAEKGAGADEAGVIARGGDVIFAGRGYGARDMERWAPELRKSQQRTAFQRDRARITHSSALRRLGGKTQVLMADSDDFARTRLTHTLEVAQIGRQIATTLGCNPDIVDCACLAHDLGHPPFGHNGESALAALAQGIGGFEGNAQTFRLLTRLEPKVFFPVPEARSAGLNLTRASLDAAVKYPWGFARAKERGTGKFCVYPSEETAFAWLKQGAPAETLPVEAQVMDLSDDIAYSVHDMEDAMVLGSFDPALMRDAAVRRRVAAATRAWYGERWDEAGVEDALGRLSDFGAFPDRFTPTRRGLAHVKNITSDLIGRFALSVERATRAAYGAGHLTRYAASVVVPEETAYEIVALKGIAVLFVMEPREHEPMYEEQRRIVTDLVRYFASGGANPPALLDTVFADDWNLARDEGERLRVAVDQVASLTDMRAIALHDALFA